MVTLIPQSQYKTMPWKNGLGQTSQIQIFPEGANFPNDFTWRLSSAHVRSNDPFSNFEKCQRVLTVVEGAGLILNDKKLLPGDVSYFSGEEKIHCKLINGPVVDLGVIWNPELVSVKLNIYDIEGVKKLNLSATDTHFICCIHGAVKVDELNLQIHDTAKVENVAQVNIASLRPQSSLALISISLT